MLFLFESAKTFLNLILRSYVNCFPLFQLITNNQERFVEMLNEPIAGQEDQEGGAEAAGHPPGTAMIQVTHQEREAIDRVSFCF